MKRIILIVLMGVVSLTLAAQPRLHQPEMYIGMHGGVLFSTTLFTPQVAGATNWVDRTLLSGNGGLIFRYNGHKYCGLQVELDYMQRGWRENTEEVEGASIHYQRRLNYIELPFMAHIYLGGDMVRGFLNVGPQIGYCVYEQSSGTCHPSKQEQYAPLDNPFDWGLTGGLGMLVRTKRTGTFQLEGRFSYSLGDYFHNLKTDYFSHSTPISLCVNIGYLWEIKPKPKSSNKTKE